VQLSSDPDLEKFREEFAAFLAEHTPAEAQALERSRSSADVPEWARRWQRLQFEHGWLLPGNPPEFGGRNASLLQQHVHLEELSRRRMYHSFNPQGLGIIAASLLSFGTGKYTYLIGYVVLFTILGCFIEPIAIMVMTLPIMYPVMVAQGFDPIWLGVVSVKLAEIGVLTPPVGLNVFVVKSSSPVPVTLGQVFTGVIPFIALDFLSLVLYVIFPEMILWLPNLMKS